MPASTLIRNIFPWFHCARAISMIAPPVVLKWMPPLAGDWTVAQLNLPLSVDRQLLVPRGMLVVLVSCESRWSSMRRRCRDRVTTVFMCSISYSRSRVKCQRMIPWFLCREAWCRAPEPLYWRGKGLALRLFSRCSLMRRKAGSLSSRRSGTESRTLRACCTHQQSSLRSHWESMRGGLSRE